jgi:signal transduction histidine kinase
VLLNLINNAIAYSDKDQPITLQLETNQNNALIHVCDRGVGIPLDQQTRIFDRFYRGDEARSRSVGGTGLGLSIVKTLVEGMEGTVSVRSTPGKGSTFTISLPIVRTQKGKMEVS